MLRGHTSEVQSVAWGADGWTIASSGNAGQVLLWDASIADSPDILVGHDRPTLALAFNLLLLVAVLSMLQATLTLPGIAAIALTLGMAIDDWWCDRTLTS